ncbi:YopX family protein [Priestia endophytica]|uniref:YopX protein domain-containing protein n=1 Tax=Priestia endophytica TaxID=135735 RepID=A0AAX1Q7F7_9BACI|nr:YopX family protein [Priestia endophytica]RAS75222.1 hypothetical protein A3864_16280 [Priestia endophytica]
MREIKFRMFDTEEKQFMNGSRVIESRVNDLNSKGRFIYQQYTGIKDQKGTDIYEGDIVQTVGLMIDNKGIVKFIDGAYCIEAFDGKEGWFLFQEIEENEVIGNVYENPELVEVKN